MARTWACAFDQRADDLALAAAQLEQAHRLVGLFGQPADQAGGGQDGGLLTQVLQLFQADFPVKIPKCFALRHRFYFIIRKAKIYHRDTETHGFLKVERYRQK